MERNIRAKITNCNDCPHSFRVPTEPPGWNDYEIGIFCGKAAEGAGAEQDRSPSEAGAWQDGRLVVADEEAPEKYAEVPSWCPLAMAELDEIYKDITENGAQAPWNDTQYLKAEEFLEKTLKELSRFYWGELDERLKSEETFMLTKIALALIHAETKKSRQNDIAYKKLYRFSEEAYGSVKETVRGYRMQLEEWAKPYGGMNPPDEAKLLVSKDDLIFALALISRSFTEMRFPDYLSDPTIEYRKINFDKLKNIELRLEAPEDERKFANRAILNFRVESGFRAGAIQGHLSCVRAAKALTEEVLGIQRFQVRVNDAPVLPLGLT